MDIYSALFGASFITLIVLFGIAIVTLVGKWKVYAKLGMPGWYSLIPVFSDYKLWKEYFWSRSFCLLTTGGAPIEVIRRYIESQGQK